MFSLLLVLVLIALGRSLKEETFSCDHLGIHFYHDIGCNPVYRNGTHCPVEFECNLQYQKNQCLLRHQLFTKGEAVDENISDPSCHMHCSCDEAGKFLCGDLDCPGIYEQPANNCYYEFHKCCPIGVICPGPENQKKCIVRGREYRLGEKFIPENRCTLCTCDENFNETFNGANCEKLVCNSQLSFAQEIQNYCAPFYKLPNKKFAHNRECCTDEVVCESESDKVITINPKSSNTETKCRFGTRLLNVGEGIKKKFNFFRQWINVTCECVIPPFLTCKG